jgi:hypothetical protein
MTISDNSLLIVLSEERLCKIITDAVKQALSEMPQFKSSGFDENELLTRKAAAEAFGVSVGTIDNYRRAGLILTCRIAGSIRFKRKDLHAAFSSNFLHPYKVSKRNRR